MTSALLLVSDVVALVAAAIAVVIDQRQRRIPNKLTAAAAVAGLVLAYALDVSTSGGLVPGRYLALSVGGGLLALLVFGAPAAFGLVGMGDVKLMAALGLLLRWPGALALVLYTALAGGVLALVHAVAGGHLRAVGRNLATLKAGDARHRMPYALAIAAGAAWTIAAGRFAALRLV